MLSCKIFKNTFLQNTSERLLLWIFCDNVFSQTFIIRGGSRAAATSKMERFVTIVTKRSILDVAAVLDPPLIIAFYSKIDLKVH